MKSTIISKIRIFATEHPALIRYGIAFAITLAIGLLDYQQASAIGCRGCEDVSQPLGAH